MNVSDLPKPANHALYAEALARYAAMVKSRAIGVHSLGPIPYPGLSGIELLVLTDHVARDNRFFFSVFHRLPQRYHALFAHEPFILPAWSLRVMRHTSRRAFHLEAGRDVLRPYAHNDEPAERWCRVLESYCAYAAFVCEVRKEHLLKARRTIEAASGFGRVLADASEILPEAANGGYVNRIDARCRTFFDEGSDPVEQVRTAWRIFSSAFDAFDALLRERLHARTTDEAVQTARARLTGDEECPDFDRDYAFRRAREIDGYQQELLSLGFPFGHLFFAAAYPRVAPATQRASVMDTVLSNVYRMRRRLTEYA